MKLARCIILLTVLSGMAATLFAGGFALSGLGTRAVSLGGAFRGMADDGSAMYWNPAGLAFLNQNEISLGVTAIQPSASWQNTDATLPGFTTTELDAVKKLRAFPNFFASYNKVPDLSFGFGAFVPYGLGSTWDAYTLPATMLGSALTWSPGFPKDEMASSVAVIDIHPTVAYRPLENFSFGLGLSLLYGSIDLAQIKPSPTSSYFAPTTFDMSGSGLGVGGNLGLMYKPLKKLSLGFNGRWPSNIYLQGEAEVLLWLSDLANFSVWGNNPAFMVPATYGGTEDITAQLKLPAELGGGLSYQLTPQMTLNLDYAYTMWDRLDMVKVEMENPIVVLAGHPTMQATVTETDLVFDWQNTHRVSLGAEYRLPCTSIRAGAYYDQTPIEEATQLPTLSDIGDKISGNLGFGRDFGNLTVDLSGQYVYFPERTVATQTATNMAGVYNASVISGTLNLKYRF